MGNCIGIDCQSKRNSTVILKELARTGQDQNIQYDGDLPNWSDMVSNGLHDQCCSGVIKKQTKVFKQNFLQARDPVVFHCIWKTEYH